MSEDRRPVVHVIAGPGGAGKTTLYETKIAPRLAQAPRVEPGSPQEAALIASRSSFVVERSIARESDLDVVKTAKSQGFDVVLHHVDVRSLALTEKRTGVGNSRAVELHQDTRPEHERIRRAIVDAAAIATRAYVYDNSQRERPPQLAAVVESGKVVRASDKLPAWVRETYSAALSHYSPARQHRAASSFADAQRIAQRTLGDEARTYIPRPGAVYSGKLIGETDLHVLQQVGKSAAIAHFRDALGGRQLKLGEVIEARYDARDRAKIRTQREIDTDRQKAKTFTERTAKDGVKQFPDLAPSYAYLKAVERRLEAAQPQAATRVAARVRADLAARIERGEPLPEIRKTEQMRDQNRAR